MTRLYFISGMFCGSCAKTVESQVGNLSGVAATSVNFASRLLRVEFDSGSDLELVSSEVERTVRRGGFGVQPQRAGWLVGFLDRLKEEQANVVPAWLLCLVFFFAMWSSTAAFAGYLGDLNPQEAWLLAAISTALGLPALLLGAWPFAKAGVRSLFRARLLTLDLFIALGGYSAAVFSVTSILSGSSLSYADSSAMVLVLLLGAKISEARLARQMAQRVLLSIHGEDPIVERVAPGVPSQKAASQIRLGNHIVFSAGETVLFDGKLLEESAQIDSHLLTGESTPTSLRRGDFISAGSIARSTITLKVEQTVGNRQIDSWAESALLSAVRPHRFSRLLSQLESRLTLVALCGSTLLGLIAYFRSGSVVSSFESFFIGVLIFCPCLFASILPYAKQFVHIALGRRGVFSHRVDCLFDLSAIKHIVFDKTGTLESLETSLVCQDPAEKPRLERLLESLLKKAPHPVLDGLPPIPSPREMLPEPVTIVTAGAGTEATWPTLGETLVVGKAIFVHRSIGKPNPGNTVDRRTLVARNGRVVAEIITGEVFQKQALDLIEQLHRTRPDLRLSILSGDPKPLAGALRDYVERKVVDYKGHLTPEEKANLVPPRSLFVGDGLNDILALAQADVSLRVGSRARGYSAVDLEISGSDLGALPYLLHISQMFTRVLTQTAAMALVYNLLAWTLAAMGWFTPLGAVCAMLTSLTLMVLSCARLLNAQPASLGNEKKPTATRHEGQGVGVLSDRFGPD